jgi:hypothetical protein
MRTPLLHQKYRFETYPTYPLHTGCARLSILSLNSIQMGYELRKIEFISIRTSRLDRLAI